MAQSNAQQIAQLLAAALATADPRAVARLRGVVADYEHHFHRTVAGMQQSPMLAALWDAIKGVK